MSDRSARKIIDPEWENLFRKEVSGERTIEEDLRDLSIFSLLSDKELGLLARSVHLRHYATGETVIRRGMPQSGFYLIRSGSVQIIRQHFDGTSEMVARLGSGELLGEFALVDSTPRTSSIVAGEPSELIGFFKPDLMGILSTTPSMGCKILLRLAETMANTLQQDYAALRAMGFSFSDQDFHAETDLVTAS